MALPLSARGVPTHKHRVSLALNEAQLRYVERRAAELSASVGGFLRDNALRTYGFTHLIDVEARVGTSKRGRSANTPAKRMMRRAVLSLNAFQLRALQTIAERYRWPLSEVIRRALDVDAPRWGGARAGSGRKPGPQPPRKRVVVAPQADGSERDPSCADGSRSDP